MSEPLLDRPPIRVVIVDDHWHMRVLLRQVLSGEPDLEVVGEAPCGGRALEVTKRLVPDLVLMDDQMPNVDGIESTRRIAQEVPSVRVIGLTMADVRKVCPEMIEAGADRRSAKDSSIDRLLSELRSLLLDDRAAATSRER